MSSSNMYYNWLHENKKKAAKNKIQRLARSEMTQGLYSIKGHHPYFDTWNVPGLDQYNPYSHRPELEQIENHLLDHHPEALLSRINGIHYLRPSLDAINAPEHIITNPLYNSIISLTHDYPHGSLHLPHIPVRLVHLTDNNDVNRQLAHTVGAPYLSDPSTNHPDENPSDEMQHHLHNIIHEDLLRPTDLNPQFFNYHLTNHLARRYLFNTLKPTRFQSPALDYLDDIIREGHFDNIFRGPRHQYTQPLINWAKKEQLFPGLNYGAGLISHIHQQYHNLPEEGRVQHYPDFIDYLRHHQENEPEPIIKRFLDMAIEPMEQNRNLSS